MGSQRKTSHWIFDLEMAFVRILLFFQFCFFFGCYGLPSCIDGSSPFAPNPPLKFCSYSGNSCCNATDDLVLRMQFEVMNVSDLACASIMKKILCAKCDSFSSKLFEAKQPHNSIPFLCNLTGTSSSQLNVSTADFCTKVWDTCQNVSIKNSPFSSYLRENGNAVTNSSYFKLSNHWESLNNFCQQFGRFPSDESLCFDGEPVSFNKTETPIHPKGLCLEKLWNESYLNMAAHPDGSDRVFLSNQQGKTWLVTIPKEGNGTSVVDESNLFLDLTDIIYFDAQFGLMSLAFHPQFSNNGRLFVSYNCDKISGKGCTGRCSCNSDNNCDPTKLGNDNGGEPCQFYSVIAEFTVNQTSSSLYLATSPSSVEVRRIFTMGLPFKTHHGGQILFGPRDGYLYFMMGDGGMQGDPFNFAQNKKSLLGKILRLDVDEIPSDAELNDLNLWGNYSIPKDNPFINDNGSQAEIWALGFGNPWRCSFDSEKPSYFFCADVGQETYEEVNLISRGGNYGWRVYEGPNLYTPVSSPGGNTSASTIKAIFPIMGYNHTEVTIDQGSASIIGGYVYRSKTDPCMTGRYLYTDLYAGKVWEGIEDPPNSGNFDFSSINFTCARDSPIPCDFIAGSSLPALGFVFSFGEDNRKDVYLLVSSGVYRITRPSRCSYSCSKENTTEDDNNNANFAKPSPSSAFGSKKLDDKVSILLFSFLLLICFL